MPSESCTLPDIEQSVVRPAIYHVLNQVFEITRLSKDTKVIFPGPSGAMQVPGSALNQDGKQDPTFQSARYTFIEVEEEYDQAAVQETSTHVFDYRPVFIDREIKMSIRPIYAPSKVTIRIRYRSPSETECRRWMAEMYQRCARGRDINLHEIAYTYPLPKVFLDFMEDIWKLREAVEGYGQSLQDYFLLHASDRLVTTANDAGTYMQLEVSEKQANIIGQFDFSVVPEKPQRQNDSATWEISFNYTFTYQRPDSLYLHYPISVHNQLLPNKYLEHLTEIVDYQTTEASRSSSYAALNHFSLDTTAMQSRPPMAYIRIPAFDDFRLSSTAPGSATVFTALCFLDEDRRTLLNLKDLSDYEIEPVLLPYLGTEHSYLSKLYHSFLHLTLYRFDDPQIDETLEILPDLTVRATRDLDPRAVYHVRLSVITQVHMVVEPAFDRLLAYPEAFVALLGSLNELLNKNPDFQNLSRRKKIEDWEMKRVYEILTGYNRGGMMTGRPRGELSTVTASAFYPNREKAQFLPQIDSATLERYFRNKRRHMSTVQTAGIIARSMN